jgi:hypothetical protein
MLIIVTGFRFSASFLANVACQFGDGHLLLRATWRADA